MKDPRKILKTYILLLDIWCSTEHTDAIWISTITAWKYCLGCSCHIGDVLPAKAVGELHNLHFGTASALAQQKIHIPLALEVEASISLGTRHNTTAVYSSVCNNIWQACYCHSTYDNKE